MIIRDIRNKNWEVVGSLVTLTGPKGKLEIGLCWNGHSMKEEARCQACWAVGGYVVAAGKPAKETVFGGLDHTTREQAEAMLAAKIEEARKLGWTVS